MPERLTGHLVLGLSLSPRRMLCLQRQYIRHLKVYCLAIAHGMCKRPLQPAIRAGRKALAGMLDELGNDAEPALHVQISYMLEHA